MFTVGLFTRPLVRTAHCRSILRSSVHTISRQPGTIMRRPSFEENCAFSCKQSSKLLSRHLSDSSGKDDMRKDPMQTVTKDWGSIEHDSDYEEFSQKVFRMTHAGHKVLVVQPYSKSEVRSSSTTNPSLRLSEAVALIQSIPNWTVTHAVACSVKSTKSSRLFGSGNLAKLCGIVRSSEGISAVFVSLDILNVSQLVELQKHFGVPVYDRYTVVIQIFRNHATSKEAKLQVAMAEIPYLQQCLKGLPEGLEDRLGEDYALIGGAGESSMEKRREMLKRREHKIREELEKLSAQRQVLRMGRVRSSVPSVAIVGYTNAGKTSLIQVLTRELTIQPRNRLFATLDVSSHRSKLPSGLELVYIDTVGFMSDLPPNLIESFKATLEDAMFADIIVHVWDVSHPDRLHQIEHVTKILNSLNVEKQLIMEMIIVGNKVDKLSQNERCELTESHPLVRQISCQTGEGVDKLENLIEKRLIETTGRKNITLKVRSGSPEHLWLLENSTVIESDVHADQNFMVVNTLMTAKEMGQFKKQFIEKHKEKNYFDP